MLIEEYYVFYFDLCAGAMPYGLLQTTQSLGMAGLRLPGTMAVQTGPVLMVSNLNEEVKDESVHLNTC